MVFSADGAWTHYNDENSGLAANHLNSLFYDRHEKILWLSTNMAGLVRFDGQTGWEVWHNGNSPIPSSYLFQLTQDADGTIYGSTYNGMIRIRRK